MSLTMSQLVARLHRRAGYTVRDTGGISDTFDLSIGAQSSALRPLFHLSGTVTLPFSFYRPFLSTFKPSPNFATTLSIIIHHEQQQS